MSTESNIAAQTAVTPDALPLHELTLIGIMHGNETSAALIRTPNGDITKVAPGDRVGTKTVAAISDDGLILAAANGTQTVLQMPS